MQTHGEEGGHQRYRDPTMRHRLAQRVVYLAEILIAHLGRDSAQTARLNVLLKGSDQRQRLLR